MDAAPLRPLGIGETLDVAIKLYRARFATLAKTVAVVVTPVYLFSTLVTLSLPNEDDLATSFDATGTEADFGDFWVFLAGFLVVGLATFIAGQLATAASYKVVGATYVGEDVEWQESLKFAVRRLRSLIWLTIVYGFLLVLAFLACIVPGIYLGTMWAVALPVLLLEDIRGRKALKRSRELVQGRGWQVFALLLLSMILTSIVGGALSGLLVGLVGNIDNELLEAVANLIGNTAGAVLTTPFSAAVIMVIYFDLRVRKEGFDLELLARNVGVDPGDIDRSSLVVPPPPPPTSGSQPPFWPPPPGWQPSDE